MLRPGDAETVPYGVLSGPADRRVLQVYSLQTVADDGLVLRDIRSRRIAEVDIQWSSGAADVDVPLLKRMAGLEGLQIWCAYGLADNDLAKLADLPSIRGLKMLGNGSFTGRGLTSLRPLRNLESLTLESVSLTDEGWESLKEFPQLTELAVSFQSRSPDGFPTRHLNQPVPSDGVLRNLRFLPNLRRLKLSGFDLDDAGLECLRTLPKLEELEIDWLPGTLGSGFSNLEKLPRFRRLTLSMTSVSGGGYKRIGRLSGLEELRLRMTVVTDDDARQIGALSNLRCLWVIHGTGNGAGAGTLGITGEGLASALRRFTKLEELDLSDNVNEPNLGDTVMPSIGALARLKRLRLENMWISDDQLRYIAALPHLEGLLLDGRGITDAGMKWLKDCRELRSLSLASTNVTDVGLAKLEGLVDLRDLNLSDTHVSDAGMARLGAMNRLETINLYSTRVTAKGLRFLHDHCPKLRNALREGPDYIEDGQLHVKDQ